MTLIPTRAPSLVGWVLGFLPWWAWAALVALALATATGMGHRAGAAGVQQRWDAEKAAAARQALEASQEARRIEQARAAKVQEVQSDYATRSNRDRAAAAGAAGELERLRDELAARDRAAAAPASTCRIDVAGAERDLFGSCAAALAEVAGEADRLETRLTALQGYVRAITAPASAPAP
jgi:hypothetical protein